MREPLESELSSVPTIFFLCYYAAGAVVAHSARGHRIRPDAGDFRLKLRGEYCGAVERLLGMPRRRVFHFEIFNVLLCFFF